MGFLGMSEEPRTLSQIKRSQIDLDRRYVFLCPTSLSKDFDAIPQQAKESCLLIFKCNRDWLFSERADLRRRFASSRLDTGTARQRKHRGARRVLSPNARSAIRAVSLSHEFSKDFLEWVKEKEKQGDVFWYKPARDLKLLSRFLEDKVDPFTSQSYKKLKLDIMWWRTRFSAGRSRYVGSAALVIQSLQEKPPEEFTVDERATEIGLPPLQELLFQSNPTLEPIVRWPHAPSMRFLPKTSLVKRDYRQAGSAYRGYIDQDCSRMGLDANLSVGVKAMRENTRISSWPDKPRMKLDNLHHLWQTGERADSARAHPNTFARLGLSSLPAMNCTL